jgi:hypothetical protein
VHRDCVHAVLARQLAHELVRAVLGADEDEREPALGAERRDELVELPVVRDGNELVAISPRSAPSDACAS